MRNAPDYDEIYRMLRGDKSERVDDKKFALGALAARIYEELVLWQRLAPLLETMRNHQLEPEELDEYNILSKKSESLTNLIVKSVKELNITDKKSVQELMDKLDKQMLSVSSNDEKETANGTASNDD